MKDLQKGTKVIQVLCSEGKTKRELALAAKVRACSIQECNATGSGNDQRAEHRDPCHPGQLAPRWPHAAPQSPLDSS